MTIFIIIILMICFYITVSIDLHNELLSHYEKENERLAEDRVNR